MTSRHLLFPAQHRLTLSGHQTVHQPQTTSSSNSKVPIIPFPQNVCNSIIMQPHSITNRLIPSQHHATPSGHQPMHRLEGTSKLLPPPQTASVEAAESGSAQHACIGSHGRWQATASLRSIATSLQAHAASFHSGPTQSRSITASFPSNAVWFHLHMRSFRSIASLSASSGHRFISMWHRRIPTSTPFIATLYRTISM